jgi:putative membrane protein
MRVFPFSFGLMLLAGLWFGPLPGIAQHAFWAHMLLHIGVVAIAAPLLALGLAGGRFDPVCRAPAWFPPVPLSLLELVMVWAWHAPVLHRAARESAAGFVVEQACFMAAGLAVWISAFGGNGSLRRERIGAGIAALLLTSMHMTLLGALLALAPRPLFQHRALGSLGALDDQHLGGAIMLLGGGLSYLTGGLWLTAILLRQRTVTREGLA